MMNTSAISCDIFQRDYLALFWTFICERQRIWERRCLYRLAPPWTDDPILREERFTNVYRELDPGTIYVVQQILETQAPVSDKIFNVMIYRLIGRSETHEILGFQTADAFDPDYFIQRIRWIRSDQGKAPFTAAYMVSGYAQMGSREKAVNIARLLAILASQFEAFAFRIRSSQSAAEAYEVIRSATGFGNFLSYQILIDLLYPLRVSGGRPLLPFSHDDWASAGPGAQRGIQMLALRDRSVNPLDVMRWLRASQQDEFKRLSLDFPYLKVEDTPRPISLANIQNCLCEFHKYVKIREGTGRGRRKFLPKGAVQNAQPRLT